MRSQQQLKPPDPPTFNQAAEIHRIFTKDAAIFTVLSLSIGYTLLRGKGFLSTKRAELPWQISKHLGQGC